MNTPFISGVYAAVLTPRRADESVDVNALTILIRFLIDKGIASFAVNGATGEFCLTTPEQLRVILTTVQKAAEGKASILCGVGAPGIFAAQELAAVAQVAGVKGILLPMPYFFPYQQQDLDLFCRGVAASTELPILLYNLPQFTSGLEKETVRSLIIEVPNIIGIKDSSGSLEILRDLTAHKIDACRMIGNDSALAQAMEENICDGVVSGVACVLPEVILALYAELGRADSVQFSASSRLLNEFIEQLSVFPTPWGLKWIAEARAILQATFSQPVTSRRLEQAKEIQTWFRDWLPRAISNETSFEVSRQHSE